MIYPLIYSISKIGCFLNGCCYGIKNINNIDYKFSLQLVDSTIMFILFFTLLMIFSKQTKDVISIFFITFSNIRFFEDYFRNNINIVMFNLTLEQIICAMLIIMVFFVNVYRIFKRGYSKT